MHAAKLRAGRDLAIKIQYPGIRDSIDSDVDNVATLLRLSGLTPEGMALEPLLLEAKRQLHAEADYQREATLLGEYAAQVANDRRFGVPAVIAAMSDAKVLTMERLEGVSIDQVGGLSRAERTRVAGALLELALRELFHWGLVQTDPNFANYLYRQQDGRIQLLDFGAVRRYDSERQQALNGLLSASLRGEREAVEYFATVTGYLGEGDPGAYRESILRLLTLVTEPARQTGEYDFSDTDLAVRMREALIELSVRSRYTRLPPPDVLFLHRKLGGLYLLLARLRVSLDVGQLIDEVVIG